MPAATAMRSLLLVCLGAVCALGYVLAFGLGRATAPRPGLQLPSGDPIRADLGDGWRLSLEVTRDAGGEGASDEREPVIAVERPLPTQRIVQRARVLAARPVAVAEERVPELDRPPDRMDGMLLEAWHSFHQLAFRGTQVPTEDGGWARDGYWEAWHENGQLHELGAYRLGEEDGVWQWWYPNGNRMAEGRYVDGDRVGTWCFWNEDGGLLMTGSYRAGQGEGLWTYFHEEGAVRAQGSLRSGAPHGQWTGWLPGGGVDTANSWLWVDGERMETGNPAGAPQRAVGCFD